MCIGLTCLLYWVCVCKSDLLAIFPQSIAGFGLMSTSTLDLCYYIVWLDILFD